MEEYEKIQDENEQILKKFEVCFLKKGLSKGIINKHINNIRLFINDYLADDWEIRPIELDASSLVLFLEWCIDKWIFNTSSGFVSALASIKIFYEYLNKDANYKIKEINKILSICDKKDYYANKFISHERLLNQD